MKEFDIFLISRSKYDSMNTRVVPLHSHSFYHLIYVVSGIGELIVQENKYAAVHNTAFVIKPDDMHSISSDEKFPLNTIEVKFQARADWVTEICLESAIVSLGKEYKRVEYLLEKMLTEAIGKNRFYMNMVESFFAEVLVSLARHQTATGRISTDLLNKSLSSEYKEIEKLIEYINQNISKKFTLEELSNIVSFSQIYLCRYFKKIYGMSLFQYINNMRMHKAKEMLMYTTSNITEIAEATGFQSIHYFSRFFSEKEGMSPLEFRQSVQRNVYIFFDSTLYTENEHRERINLISDNIGIIG